ncbi:MAG: ubiquinone/menaquinone biosynthesis methyltransferase [Desulfomonile tiedjei]|uniref:Ubiquinone/menaquinone biosynthesis methyltransferase n=1 Tax=Desulfomonile tiedjei TaxID=2358 RepID=A0A9D6Z4T3_9BACT|nr:ubiquinone/menaquinone biosynthesis methyltransferase [Desulfomonile tiedjei]
MGLDGLWRRRAVARLDPQPGHVYLDAGCGTGDASILLAKRSPGCKLIGIDPSQAMLRIGMSKVEKAGLVENISMLPGNVLDLQFPDKIFDGVITAFCIRNVTDRMRALAELRRVIRPGGVLVILELIQPDGVMKPLFRLYSKVVMPLVTALMSSVPAYRYLSDSMADFPRPEEWLRFMEEAGFTNTETEPLTGGISRIFVGRVPTLQR